MAHPRTTIAAILPAAGSSTRLGANKLLIELGGEPLVRRAARRALDAGLDPVILVLGHDHERVRTAVAGLPVMHLLHTGYAEGMPSSLREGIGALPPSCEAAVVVLPDMPLVTASMLAELMEQYRSGRPRLVVSLYGDTPAPPILYSRALFPDLLAAREGGREVVRTHLGEAAVVHHPAELLADLDRPADLERVRALDPGT